MSKYSVTRIYAGGPNVARRGIALASAFALSVSGCDSSGPDIANQPGTSDDLSDTRLLYREGGVVLSKSASDELADFVAATQFDAVLPMSVRLNTMGRDDRENFFKRLESARQEVESAAAVVETAGESVKRGDLERLDAANRRIENIMRVLLRKDEQERSRERAARLIKKYPILSEMSRDQVERVLLQATGAAAKVRLDEGMSYSVQGDTSDGDTCHIDCAVQYVIDFAVTEITFGGWLFGCTVTGPAYLGCAGWGLAIQWSMLVKDTYTYYTCTKTCS